MMSMMRVFTRRNLRRCLKCIALISCSLYLLSLLLLHGSIFFSNFSLCLMFDVSCSVDRQTLAGLMAQDRPILLSSNISAVSPLEKLFIPGTNFLSFYDLPKRKHYLTYGEITSANRNTEHRLTPDFTFHLEYEAKHVTLYRDFGPGCIYRIFLYPALPTDYDQLHRLTVEQLKEHHLVLRIDGESYSYSLDRVMSGKDPPFVFPFSVRHPRPATGLGAYTPICYQHSMTVYYKHNKELDRDLLQRTVNCTENELKCSVKIYSAVSRHKLPYGIKVQPYRQSAQDLALIQRAARLLESPETRGPDGMDSCVLSCVTLCKGCQRVLHHTIHTAGVISAIKFRVHQFNGQLSTDWMDFMLSVYVDDPRNAQIDRVPLGSLFGVAGSLNDFRGAAFGRRKRYCYYDDGSSSGWEGSEMTGYLYLPMPYWREALVVLERSEGSVGDPHVCSEISIVENHYDQTETGYLHIHKSYYGSDIDGWRNVLDVSGGWGHVVGLGVEIDNLWALRDVPLAYRWAALQADPIVYIDNAPAVLGTGLEDYFSYAHGFSGAENTTYPLVGVYHSGAANQKEPLTWHCYRQQVLDVMPFSRSVRFVMEGTHKTQFYKPAQSVNYTQHGRLKASRSATLAHVVYYYFHPQSNNTSNSRAERKTDGHTDRQADRQEDIQLDSHCDKIHFGDEHSEHFHSLQITGRGRIFRLDEIRYIGDSATNNVLRNVTGRSFKRGDRFTFVMNILADRPVDVLTLRRTYHGRVGEWNSKASLSVDGNHVGMWFIPMGTLSEVYSVGVDQVMVLRPGATNWSHHVSVTVGIEALTMWRDISYELCSS